MGLAGEFGITYTLPRLIGFPRALKFLAEGDTMDARWRIRQDCWTRWWPPRN